MSPKNRNTAILTIVATVAWFGAAAHVGGLVGGLMIGVAAGIGGALWIAWDLGDAARKSAYSAGWVDAMEQDNPPEPAVYLDGRQIR